MNLNVIKDNKYATKNRINITIGLVKKYVKYHRHTNKLLSKIRLKFNILKKVDEKRLWFGLRLSPQ